jgi:hypothetical protein
LVFDSLFFYKEYYTERDKDRNREFDMELYDHQRYDSNIWENEAEYRDYLIDLHDWDINQFTKYFKDPQVYKDLYEKTYSEKVENYCNKLNFVAINPERTIDFANMDEKVFKKAIGNMLLSKVEFGLKTYQFSHWHQFIRDCGLDPDGDVRALVKTMGQKGFFEDMPMRRFKRVTGMACLSELEKNQREHMSYESEVFMTNIGKEGMLPHNMYRAERAGIVGNMQPIGVTFNDVESLAFRASIYADGLSANTTNTHTMRVNSGGQKALLLKTGEKQTKQQGIYKTGVTIIKDKGGAKPKGTRKRPKQP